MNFFLTGVTGFIGEQLAIRLLSEGHTVRMLSRSRPSDAVMEYPQAQWIQGDILQPDTLKLLIEGCEAGFHLAGFAKIWSARPQDFFEINTLGSELVFRICMEMGVTRLVYTSTAGTIGPSYGLPANEETIRLHDFFNEYESSKFLSEERALRYVRAGLDIVMVNPTRVYGPGVLSESNGFVRLAKMYREGKWKNIPGDGQRLGNYVYIDDVVEGLMLAYQQGRAGERYLLGGEDLSYNEFFRLLAELSGKQVRMRHTPLWMMMLFGRIQLMKAKLTGSQPLITPAWVKKYQYDWAVSSEKATRELGYRITPFREGMQRTLNWLASLD